MENIEPKTIRSLIHYIRSDLRRYRATGAKSNLRAILNCQGLWASSAFRLSNYLFNIGRRLYLLRLILGAFNLFLLKFIQIITGISIPTGCQIGKGLYIGHFGGIIINGEAEIGENCNIACQVVIGYGKSRGRFGVPKIGNRVFIGPGAKIIGPVSISDDAAIGANAVVTADIPSRAVAVGIPAKIINYQGSFEYNIYDDMENDLDRMNSIKQMEIQTDTSPISAI